MVTTVYGTFNHFQTMTPTNGLNKGAVRNQFTA